MASFKLLNYRGTDGAACPAVLAGDDQVFELRQSFPDARWTSSILAVLNAWEHALPALREHAADPQGPSKPLSSVKLMAPILYPPAIYCTGANYRAHAQEMNAEDAGVDKATGKPYLFLKSGPHCVVGPGDAIRLPGVSQKVDWEGELAVVIGRRARNVERKDA